MKFFKQSLKQLLVLFLILSWVFAGFPHLVLEVEPSTRTFTQTRVARVINIAQAATAGPTGAGTAQSGTTASCADNMNWSVTTTDLQSNDTSYVTYSGNNWDSGEITDIVEASGFGFSVSGSVTGITVEVLGWTTAGSGTYHTVQLMTVPGGTPTLVGANKASGSLPTSDPGSTYQTFGGTTDTWSAGLTDTQVNDSGFGVGLCWTAGAANSRANIDQVRITITYSVGTPTVVTSAASSVTDNSATLNGSISATGGENASTRGFVWGTDSTLQNAIATTTESGSFGTGSFTQNLSNLVAGVTYYFKAYATNSGGTGYGSITNFTAGAADTTVKRTIRLFEGFTIKLLEGRRVVIYGLDPMVAEFAVTTNGGSWCLGTDSGLLSGTITGTGGQNATDRGFAWGLDSTLQGASTTTDPGSWGTGVFLDTATPLTGGQTYYFRAYATNPSGTVYGTILSMVESGGC